MKITFIPPHNHVPEYCSVGLATLFWWDQFGVLPDLHNALAVIHLNASSIASLRHLQKHELSLMLYDCYRKFDEWGVERFTRYLCQALRDSSDYCETLLEALLTALDSGNKLRRCQHEARIRTLYRWKSLCELTESDIESILTWYYKSLLP